jgi:hypothetical protein
MLTEVERLFLSAKLVISDNQSCLEPASIESGECIRSWVGAKLFFDDYFDYLSHDGMLREHMRT